MICDEILNHIQNRTIYNIHLFSYNPTAHKEISSIGVFVWFPIPFNIYSTLVVLMGDVIAQSTPLGFQELPGPERIWHSIFHYHHFWFSGTFCIKIFLRWHINYWPFPQDHHSVRVYLCIILYIKIGIEVLADHIRAPRMRYRYMVNTRNLMVHASFL